MRWWLGLREDSKGDCNHYILKWTLSNNTKKNGTAIKKNRTMNTRSNYELCTNKPCNDLLHTVRKENEDVKKEKWKNIEMKKSIYWRRVPSVHRCIRKVESEVIQGLVTPVQWARSLAHLYLKVNFMPKSKSSCNASKNGENRSSIKGIKLRRVCLRPSLLVRLVKRFGTIVPKDDSHLC